MPFQRTSFELWAMAILALFFISSPTSNGQVAVPGQLCISDCSTCPVVCTAATTTPPALESPPRNYIPPPPPPGFYGGYMTPSSYSFWAPPPPPPPPPVGNYFSGARPSGEMPRTAGPADYSYPYYYFYSSNSCCSLCSVSVFVVLFVCLFHFGFRRR